MAINQNPFYQVSSLVDLLKGSYSNPVAQAMLEAEIWERRAINTLYSCADKNQDSPTVQNMIMRGQWQMEVADNYLTAAVELEEYMR